MNNDITHFDNASFKPQFQQRQTGKDLNGWWNPSGDAVFRLANCRSHAAFKELRKKIEEFLQAQNVDVERLRSGSSWVRK